MELTPKQFELLLCEFCKQDLPPNFVVEPDAKEKGKESGGRRQIDTKIKGRIGISDILICGEAKNWDEAVGSETIDALVGKYFSGEVRANKVLLFSNNGFSSPAITRAKTYGIELIEPFELNNPVKLVTYIVELGYLNILDFTLSHSTGQHTIMSLNADDYLIFKGEEKMSLYQFAFRHINSKLIKIPNKKITTDLETVSFTDTNVVYEFVDGNGHRYFGDFEFKVTLIWNYFVKYLNGGILHHVNTGEKIFVNLQGTPKEAVANVLSPGCKYYSSKADLYENVLNIDQNFIFIPCTVDPNWNKVEVDHPSLCFV